MFNQSELVMCAGALIAGVGFYNGIQSVRELVRLYRKPAPFNPYMKMPECDIKTGSDAAESLKTARALMNHAQCKDCSFSVRDTAPTPHAIELGQKHASRTGHVVVFEKK